MPVWNVTSGKTLTQIGRKSASFQLPVGYFGLSIDIMYSHALFMLLYKCNCMDIRNIPAKFGQPVV